jgi:hypothetical protein
MCWWIYAAGYWTDRWLAPGFEVIIDFDNDKYGGNKTKNQKEGQKKISNHTAGVKEIYPPVNDYGASDYHHSDNYWLDVFFTY